MVAAALASAGCSAEYRPAIPAVPQRGAKVAVESSATRIVESVRKAALPRRTDSRGVPFDAPAAIAEARRITAFGVRKAGSSNERAAARHIAGRLRSFGLRPRYQYFDLPNGGRSVNVLVSIPGVDTSRALLMGGHIDSKPPSPGGNDNASGCGVLLEIARRLADSPGPVTVDLVFWGSEEAVFGSPDVHHLGSRHHARSLSAAERRRYVGLVNVDMVGRGERFLVRTMGRGPMSLTRTILSDAKADGVRLRYSKDPGKTGWSDHEAYELLGMPVAWLEWPEDARYHTSGDTASRLQARPVRITGELVSRFAYSLDEERIRRIDAR